MGKSQESALNSKWEYTTRLQIEREEGLYVRKYMEIYLEQKRLEGCYVKWEESRGENRTPAELHIPTKGN
jgi:hypothetical protein